MALENTYLLLFFIAHFLGDFQLQSQALAENKKKFASGVWKHLGIHAALITAIILLVPEYFFAGLIIWSSHFLIDSLKQFIEGNEKAVYIVDQLLHLAIIVIVGEVFTVGGVAVPEWLGSNNLLQWALLMIVITKPVNTTFKKSYSNSSSPWKTRGCSSHQRKRKTFMPRRNRIPKGNGC